MRFLVIAILVTLFFTHPVSRARGGESLTVLDLRAALGTEDDRGTRWAYDVTKAIGALQGIVNRERPRLFVTYLHIQMARERGLRLEEPTVGGFWLNHLRQEGKMLADYAIHETTDVWRAFDLHVDGLEGLAVWDEKVPSTANVASTVAGSENLLPVRGSDAAESFFVQIRDRYPDLDIKVDLRGKFTGAGTIDGTAIPSSGSAKCDAYLWAVEHYLKTGKCGSTHLAFYVDGIPWNKIAPKTQPYPDLGNAGVLNADYWISHKAFFFDLSPWEDRSATDDPGQPVGTDCRTLLAILQSANDMNDNNAVITCGGFLPWWLKYCRSGWGGRDPDVTPNDPVPTEWLLVDILSAYNTILDADAFGLTGLANASVYRHAPLETRYDQTPKRQATEYDPETVYVLFALLDYDSAAWLAQTFPVAWEDPKRGDLPFLWGFNPILSDRVPMVFDAVYETQTPADTIGADEGLGYINPNLIEGDRKYSNLPSFRETYLKQARKYYEQFSMDTTAFVITGHQGNATDDAVKLLAQLSPGGVGFQGGGRVRDGENYGVAFKGQEEDWNPGFSPEKVADRLENQIRAKGPGSFLFFRCILMRPSQIVEGVEILRKRAPDLKFKVLDPGTYFEFLKERFPEGEEE